MAQAAIPARLVGTRASTRTTDSVRWRWAGGLGIAHVIVLFGAFSIEGVGTSAEQGTSPAKVADVYGGLGVGRVFLASYVEAMAFVILVPALVLMSRLFARRSETGRVAAQTFLALGIAYVASTLAIGFPPLTAAVSAAHRGIDAGTISTVNDLRDYGYILQVALSLAFVLALGVAALAERSLMRWAGWGGVVVGALGVVATPFAQNAIGMVWMVWWVGLCVLCLRGGPRVSKAAPADSTPTNR
jgi:hypothetical protein